MEAFLALIPLLTNGLPKAYEAAVALYEKIQGGHKATAGDYMVVHAAALKDGDYQADIDAAKRRSDAAAAALTQTVPARVH